MKKFELFRYIKKWLPLIVLLCVLLTAAVYVFLSRSQNYVASAVIQYNSVGAEEGKTPIGTDLDVNAIKSSGILSKVMENLQLDPSKYSVDQLISSISITEVIDEDEELRKEAVLDSGEKYLIKPTAFVVSFEAEHDESEAFARLILDEVLDVYFTDFSEKYVNMAASFNSVNDIDYFNYDYIEMMEIIDGNIAETLKTLMERMQGGADFRSTATGLSFADLASEFNFIQSVQVSDLYSRILENRITKNQELLLDNYAERIKNYGISNQAQEKKIEDILVLIDAYVEKMRQSGNTNITYEYILDEVYQNELVNIYGDIVGQGNQTVTYDKLIFSWRDHNESKEFALIDSAYCSYIMSVFNDPAPSPSGSGVITALEKDIETLRVRLNDLNTRLAETNKEYNEYLGAYNISTLSTVSVVEKLNVTLYTGIAAAFLLIVCCCGAILLGRLEDIIQYLFYTDRLTGLNNRSAFDSYLRIHDKKLLGEGMVCVSVAILNQPQINGRYGRETGDQLIRFFADNLRESFHKTDSYVAYNGKGQFFVIAENLDFSSVESIMTGFCHMLDRREIVSDMAVEFDAGIAETARSNAYRIRTLLSAAVNAHVKHTSAPSRTNMRIG